MSLTAGFSKEERSILLAVKGVGPTVIHRFEQLGISTLTRLAEQDDADLCAAIAALLGTSCWRNSPAARSAVAGAIAAAQLHAMR